VQASGPVKEDTVTGTKIATVERREACVPVTRHAAPSKVPDQEVAPFRRSAPSRGEGREMTAVPKARLRASGRAMADQTTGAMNHVCMLLEMTRVCESCLTTESENADACPKGSVMPRLDRGIHPVLPQRTTLRFEVCRMFSWTPGSSPGVTTVCVAPVRRTQPLRPPNPAHSAAFPGLSRGPKRPRSTTGKTRPGPRPSKD
jgi:hypothetical protein